MKKLITIAAGLLTMTIMDKPKSKRDVPIINNYFIKNERSGGCGGSCGGSCKCGGHH